MNQNQNAEQIILLYAKSQYDLFGGMVGDLNQAFLNLGYQSTIVDVNSPEAGSQLNSCLSKGNTKFFFAINSVGYGLTIQDEPIYNRLNIPLFAWYIDHPFHHIHGVPANIQNYSVGFIDPSHESFWDAYIPGPEVKGFVPHAGSTYVEQIKPIDERPIDIFFSGSLGNYANLKEKLDTHYPEYHQPIQNTLDEAIADNTIPLHQLFWFHLVENGKDPAQLNASQAHALLSDMDLLIRNYHREQIVAQLHDFKMVVYGNGWVENFKAPKGRIEFREPLPFQESVKMMNDAKIALNHMPHAEGTHERLFYAMLQGAACIANANPWLISEFKDGESIGLYQLSELDNLANQVQQLFNQPEKLQDIANQGYRLCVKHHNWDVRAKAIIRMVNVSKSLTH